MISSRRLRRFRARLSRLVKLSRTLVGLALSHCCSMVLQKKEVTKLPSYIKDTTHFLNKLNSIGQLPNGVSLVTLDVASLYTNIPHNDGIQACSDFLDKRVNPTIKTTRLCDLIRMILTNNTFTFNGQHYRQINGTAMGTKMAPSYANLFMGNFEQKALAAATHSPLIWWRYIDDIFLLWTHGEEKLNDLITYLNNLHPTIKFTSSFSYNEIPFLDVKVMLLNGRLETELYVKPTDKHQYLLKSSCHPSHTKQSIPFSMASRLRRICSTDEFFNTHGPMHSQVILSREDTNTVSLKTKSTKYAKFHAVEPSKHPRKKSPTEFHL